MLTDGTLLRVVLYVFKQYKKTPQLRPRRNITFCVSKKYHLPKANITLALREYH